MLGWRTNGGNNSNIIVQRIQVPVKDNAWRRRGGEKLKPDGNSCPSRLFLLTVPSSVDIYGVVLYAIIVWYGTTMYDVHRKKVRMASSVHHATMPNAVAAPIQYHIYLSLDECEQRLESETKSHWVP